MTGDIEHEIRGDVEALVDGIRRSASLDDHNRTYAVIDGWAAEGRARALVALADALEAAAAAATGPSQDALEAAADRLEQALVRPVGPANVDALLRVLARARVHSVHGPQRSEARVRALASRLGASHDRHSLLAAIARAPRGPHDELLACWMHEAILRGAALEHEPVAIDFQRSLAERGHALGELPLARLASEAGLARYLPRYGRDVVAQAMAPGADAPASGPLADAPPVTAPHARPIADDAMLERVASAVEPWVNGSNGKLEANAFELVPPLGDVVPGAWLVRALPLACLDGRDLRVERAELSRICSVLFSASSGGAYSSGLGGAYGRRAVWTSVAALAGAPATMPVVEVDALAARCAWLTFRAHSGWWYDVAWDLGVLAVRAGGGSVAVLAATDTD